MCQLVETIKCIDGKLENLKYHQTRFNHTRKTIFGTSGLIMLEEFISVPAEYNEGLFKCRLVYASEIEKIEFQPYQYRPVKQLALIECNDIEYSFKFTNRQLLNRLYEQRGTCDDIIIVKNGCITDSFMANLIFFDGSLWWTPDTPLLAGTQRARLLDEKRIFSRRITPRDLVQFEKAGLINAMLNMNDMPVVEITDIEGV